MPVLPICKVLVLEQLRVVLRGSMTLEKGLPAHFLLIGQLRQMQLDMGGGTVESK